jgi:hypothetical protein
MDLHDETDVVTDRRRPGWRARLIVEDDAGEPWGDALAPALLIGRDGSPRVAADVYQDRHAARITHAWQHFNNHDMFARYLRLFHGSTTVVTAASGDTTVLTYDTSRYREHIGITGAADLTGDRDEWQSWLDGDVYGVIVEHPTHPRPCVHCRHQPEPGWVEVDACWGFYGRRYAAQQALQLLRAAARS